MIDKKQKINFVAEYSSIVIYNWNQRGEIMQINRIFFFSIIQVV